MTATLIQKQRVTVNFMKYPLFYTLKLKGEQAKDLYNMILWCFGEYDATNTIDNLEDIEQLELLVMLEVQRFVFKKINNEVNVNNYSIKLTSAQARTMYAWMNDFHFEHPMWEILSKNVVEQLYKQVNNY